MTTDDSAKVIRLVREVDRLRHDLATEQTRSGALKMQNDRLRKAVVALRRQQPAGASGTFPPFSLGVGDCGKVADARGQGMVFEPTDEERILVERLTGLMVPQAEIARDWIKPPIDGKTLRKHFRVELSRGRVRTYARIKAQLMRAAENGNVRAQVYLMERFFADLHPRAPAELPALPPPFVGGSPVRIVYEIPDNGRDPPLLLDAKAR